MLLQANKNTTITALIQHYSSLTSDTKVTLLHADWDTKS